MPCILFSLSLSHSSIFDARARAGDAYAHITHTHTYIYNALIRRCISDVRTHARFSTTPYSPRCSPSFKGGKFCRSHHHGRDTPHTHACHRSISHITTTTTTTITPAHALVAAAGDEFYGRARARFGSSGRKCLDRSMPRNESRAFFTRSRVHLPEVRGRLSVSRSRRSFAVKKDPDFSDQPFE